MTDELDRDDEARRLFSGVFPDSPGHLPVEDMLRQKLFTFGGVAGMCGWANELDAATSVRVFSFIHAVVLADPGMTGDALDVWSAAWTTVRDMETEGVLVSLEQEWRAGCGAGHSKRA